MLCAKSFPCSSLALFITAICAKATSASHGVLPAPRELIGNRRFTLGDSAGCPTEHFMGVARAVISDDERQSRDITYKTDDEISFTCNVDKTYPDANDDDYFIFPTNHRKCKPDGTWSGFPPACVKAANHFHQANHIESLRAIASRVDVCAADTCTYERDNWPVVGELDARCSPRAHHLDEAHQGYQTEVTEIMFSFPRHFYFNSMTFSLPPGKSTYQVEVRAPSYGVIREFSNQSSDFLDSHYKGLEKAKHLDISAECAVTRMDVYTNKLLVRFSIKAEGDSLDWTPLPKFYPVPQVDKSTKTVRNSWNGSGCTEPPTIPNTKRTCGSRNECRFDCLRGSMLIDPITNNTADKQIRCLNSHEWGPYPLPVCRQKVPLPPADVGSGSEQGTSHAPSPTAHQSDPYLNQLEEKRKVFNTKPSRMRKKTRGQTVRPASITTELNIFTVPFRHETLIKHHISRDVPYSTTPGSFDSKEMNVQQDEIALDSGGDFPLFLGLGIVIALIVTVAVIGGVFFILRARCRPKYSAAGCPKPSDAMDEESHSASKNPLFPSARQSDDRTREA